MKFNDLQNGFELIENRLKPTIPNNIGNRISDTQDIDKNNEDLSILDIVCYYLEKDEIITRWDK